MSSGWKETSVAGGEGEREIKLRMLEARLVSKAWGFYSESEMLLKVLSRRKT